MCVLWYIFTHENNSIKILLLANCRLPLLIVICNKIEHDYIFYNKGCY